MTVPEIESACDASKPLDITGHEIEGSELSYLGMFYPYGFPTQIRTNASELLARFGEMWDAFEQRFDTEPIRVDVHVVKTETTECPPGPTYRLMRPLMTAVADGDNYMVADLARSRSQLTISDAAMNHKQYLWYFFLEASACQHIGARFTTPVHGGCVARNGRGVLLLGDSGAGKSTLSYACARAGWTYVTDDGSFLLNGGSKRTIIGNCHQVRFRPTAATLFPELEGFKITPRAKGKPSVEVPTAALPHMTCAQTAQVDFLVFLNRHAAGPPELVPYRKEVARFFMRQTLYGLDEWCDAQYAAIEQLLAAEVFELRYSDLDWAVQRLERLTQEGC
jgi:hypothetical protein